MVCDMIPFLTLSNILLYGYNTSSPMLLKGMLSFPLEFSGYYWWSWEGDEVSTEGCNIQILVKGLAFAASASPHKRLINQSSLIQRIINIWFVPGARKCLPLWCLCHNTWNSTLLHGVRLDPLHYMRSAESWSLAAGRKDSIPPHMAKVLTSIFFPNQKL